jgi:Kef-type K+ transport system membrane component KefB
MSYLPYEEPGIATILSLTSLIVLLNAARYGLDKVLYCGLVGEIFLGTVWGLPLGGTALLSLHTQEVIQTLGYLGLIGLVFHGGLSTSPTHLRQAMLPSISVATVGLLLPIALSFLLLFFPFDFDGKQLFPTPLAAFSAGASLCSTSLGTTFAVLSSANMLKTRVGVVLVGAAMMDDIVGLVMVNIITTLGQGITGPWQVARPIVASFGLILVTIFITSLVIRPLCAWLRGSLPSHDIDQLPASQRMCFRGSNILGYLRKRSAVGFIFSLGTLLVFITVASFIDASVLLAAFLAGMVVHFVWGSVVEDMSFQSAIAMFDRYYQPLLDYLLVPFFFVSRPFYPCDVSLCVLLGASVAKERCTVSFYANSLSPVELCCTF